MRNNDSEYGFSMLEPQLQHLKYLTQNSDFELREKHFHNAAKKNTLINDNIIKNISSSFLDPSLNTVCARGSYGAGLLASRSDIDLVLLGISFNQEFCESKWYLNCNECVNDMSLIFCPQSEIIESSPHIGSLFILNSIRYVWGNLSLYQNSVQTAINKINSMDLITLVDLFVEDPFRSHKRFNPGSSHYYDIKKGFGGLFDCEFFELINIWKLNNYDKLPANTERIIAISKLCKRFLVILKSYIHDQPIIPKDSIQSLAINTSTNEDHSIAGPFYFENDNINFVRSLNSSLVDQFIRTIKISKEVS
ncbi:MAG: hypothetical protein K8R85_00395 [Bacteroidetes bacterium]|nr:hypothetical protein [Bacteroidota bacterium]